MVLAFWQIVAVVKDVDEHFADVAKSVVEQIVDIAVGDVVVGLFVAGKEVA